MCLLENTFKYRVVVRPVHSGMMYFTWTNKDLSCLFPGGAFKWSKRVLERCDRIKGFFDSSVCLCGSPQLWGHLTVQKTHGLLHSLGFDMQQITTICCLLFDMNANKKGLKRILQVSHLDFVMKRNCLSIKKDGSRWKTDFCQINCVSRVLRLQMLLLCQLNTWIWVIFFK